MSWVSHAVKSFATLALAADRLQKLMCLLTKHGSTENFFVVLINLLHTCVYSGDNESHKWHLQLRLHHCVLHQKAWCTFNNAIFCLHNQAVNASDTAGDRWRSATLSLDGVLDYDESDKDEVTFELSLFAESFQDMLMRDYGETVYEAMQSFR